MVGEESSSSGFLRKALKSHVFSDLDSMDGTKVIIWEAEVLKRIDTVIGKSEFDEHNVSRHILMPRSFAPGDDLTLDSVNHVIFVVPPEKEVLNLLKVVILRKRPGIQYHVRVVSRAPSQLKDLLNEKPLEGKMRSFDIWPFFWFPSFNDYVLNAFKPYEPTKLLLNDDYELFYLSASALATLGRIPLVRYKGAMAKQIIQNMKTLKNIDSPCLFDELVVVDRTVDPLTPLLQQTCFSGVLDSLFGIDVKECITVSQEILERKQLVLDAHDLPGNKIKLSSDIYADLMHLTLNDAVSRIRTVFKDLTEIEEAHKQLSTVNDFMKYMPSLQKLTKSKEKSGEAFHLLTIAYCYNSQFEVRELLNLERELLNGNYGPSSACPDIERLLITGTTEKEAFHSLALIAIQSLSNGGLSAKVWNDYQKLAVQNYGPEAATWCLNLQTLGLVHNNGSSSQPNKYAHIPVEMKRLRVLIDASQDRKAEFYPGYVPLLVRHIERALKDQWRGFELDNEVAQASSTSSPVLSGSRARRALFIVGGATRAELACLRSLDPAFDAIFVTNILRTSDLSVLCKSTE